MNSFPFSASFAIFGPPGKPKPMYLAKESMKFPTP